MLVRSLAATLAVLCGGCMLLDARQQQARMDDNCVIRGTATSAQSDAPPIVVVLFRESRVVDHFVLDGPGRWAFTAPPGNYALAAFEDRSRDLVYQAGEPHGAAGFDKPFVCADGLRHENVAIAIPPRVTGPVPRELDIAALQKRSVEDQARHTLGQLTVTGELILLSDVRFSDENASASLWRPVDFVTSGWAGIYFLDRYDSGKIPVLFVHGISGSPANFAPIIEKLDRSRYQPWVYYYPSGVRLAAIADHLEQTMAKLEARYGFRRFAVVAHSMGGLVSRGFIQRRAANRRRAAIPLYITMSTPWGGHAGAEVGVRTSPVVLEVWRDMAPGSDYQRALFATPLPSGIRHHLLFTYKDETVSIDSQLAAHAQRDAARLYGFGESHMGVLRNGEVSALVNLLLNGL